MSDTIQEHIEVSDERTPQSPRITGHRIWVLDVVIWHEKLGMSADEIVDQYPTITLADVYAALAYYWDHRDEIEHDITEEHATALKFAQDNPGPLTEKLQLLGRA